MLCEPFGRLSCVSAVVLRSARGGPFQPALTLLLCPAARRPIARNTPDNCTEAQCDIICLQEVSAEWALGWKDALGEAFTLTHGDKKAIFHRNVTLALRSSSLQDVFPEQVAGPRSSRRDRRTEHPGHVRTAFVGAAGQFIHMSLCRCAK